MVLPAASTLLLPPPARSCGAVLRGEELGLGTARGDAEPTAGIFEPVRVPEGVIPVGIPPSRGDGDAATTPTVSWAVGMPPRPASGGGFL